MTEHTSQGTRQHLLELEQRYQEIRGTFSAGAGAGGGEAAPLSLEDARLRGRELRFSVGTDPERRFEGRVNGSELVLVEEGSGKRLSGRRLTGKRPPGGAGDGG